MVGVTVPHLDVNKNPSRDIKRNCENVMRFPLPGSSLTSSSRNTTLVQQPRKTQKIAIAVRIVLASSEISPAFRPSSSIDLVERQSNLRVACRFSNERHAIHWHTAPCCARRTTRTRFISNVVICDVLRGQITCAYV